MVDRPVLGGGHQPGTRVARHARLGPLLERGDERILREILGQADVAHDPRQPGDEPRRFDPPDRVDGAVMSVPVSVTSVDQTIFSGFRARSRGRRTTKGQ